MDKIYQKYLLYHFSCFKIRLDLFNSNKKHKTDQLYGEVALCNLQGHIFGLEEINCTNSPIRGLTAVMVGW